MALDKAYFDSIQINVVKKKYYNANKVEAVFQDIRRQAEALQAENEALLRQLAVINDRKYALGDTVLSAQTIYQDVVAKANRQAEEILAQAERRRVEILAETQQRQEYAVQRVEACFSRMRAQHLACIETINAEWQDFLCGLFPEDGEPPAPVPTDLSEKVGAIAQELFAIEDRPLDGEDTPFSIKI